MCYLCIYNSTECKQILLQNVFCVWYNVVIAQHFFTLQAAVWQQEETMRIESVLFVNQHWRELNPTQCGREQCAPSHHYGPAVRDCYLLHYVVSGKGSFSANGSTYALRAGDTFVIRPYELTFYEADKAQPWEYIWIGFEANVSLPKALEKDVFRLPHAHSLFEAMIETSRMPSGREAALCGFIWQLLARLYEQEGTPKADSARAVEIAVSCLKAEYAQGISVTQLAQRLHLDRSYFSTMFRKKNGLSPQQYLTRVRLEKAAELMVQHGYAPGEAAASVGYPDIFSFSKMFKRHYGCAPSAYKG